MESRGGGQVPLGKYRYNAELSGTKGQHPLQAYIRQLVGNLQITGIGQT